jgi:hypothetical protein
MARSEQPRTTARSAPTAAGRLRGRYHATSLGTRLGLAAVLVAAVALAAHLAGTSALLGAVAAVLLLAAFAAWMRSPDAVATVAVSGVWVVVAFLVFQVTLGYASSWSIALVLLPLPVVLAASRIRAHPVWHTTLIALVCALIAGLAVLLADIFLAGYHRIDDFARRHTTQITYHTRQLDIGIFQKLVNTVLFRGDLLDDFAFVARQIPKLANRARRDKTAF